MVMMASKMRIRALIKKMGTDTPKMLMCSYLCSAVGVTNGVAVPVDMAERVKCALFFSEWLGKTIEIHHSFGFKMTVLAMGAFAADAVCNTFSLFSGSSMKVNYINVTNSAAIAYNVVKIPGVYPILDQVTINRIIGTDETLDRLLEPQLEDLPKVLLAEYMNEKTISPLTNTEDLCIPFMIMARN